MKRYSLSTIVAIVATMALLTTLGSLMAGAEGLATAGGFFYVAAIAATALTIHARTNKRV